MSKRDASFFFDVLRAPEEAQKWFCGPPLTASELALALGCPLSGLSEYWGGPACWELAPDTLLYPASTTWPMGFSWSSAVAQDTTLVALLATGLPALGHLRPRGAPCRPLGASHCGH